MGDFLGYNQLTAPAGGDVLSIVDVDDTTMSAQGTSKYIALSDLPFVRDDVSDTKTGALTLNGKLTMAGTIPMNVAQASSPPSSPSTADIYLDDGSNTASGKPGWRRYNGSSWEDIAAASGTSTLSGLSDTTLNSPSQHDVLSYDGSKWINDPNIARTDQANTFSAQQLFPAGSVGSPGIGIDGDSDTGLFRPAADELALTAGGVEGIRMVESGGVPFCIPPSVGQTDTMVVTDDGSTLSLAGPGHTVIGRNLTSDSGNSYGENTQVGAGSTLTSVARRCVLIGNNTFSKHRDNTVIGHDAQAGDSTTFVWNSLVLGSGAKAFKNDSIVMAGGNLTDGHIAAGLGVNCDHAGGIAFGRNVATVKRGDVVFGSGLQDSPLAMNLRLQGAPNNNNNQGTDCLVIETEWLDDDKSTRRIKRTDFVPTYNGKLASSYDLGVDHSGSPEAHRCLHVSTADPDDAGEQPNDSLSFYINGSGNLVVQRKDGSGTVSTGTVTLN